MIFTMKCIGFQDDPLGSDEVSVSLVLAVPKIQSDDLVQHHPERGLVRVNPLDEEGWLTNLELPGRDVLVGCLGEQRLQLVQQQDLTI